MHTVEIVNSIKGLKREEWDALIDDNIFASYGWLKTVERTFVGDVSPEYILVKDSGRLIGAAVCYVSNKTTNPDINLNNFMFGRLMKYTSKLGISFMPSFICCPMKCHGEHFLVEKGTDEEKRGVIMGELLDAIEKESSAIKLSVSFTNVLDEETELIQLLDKRGYKKMLSLPLNYLDIEWSSFEGYKKYVGRISKNMKQNIKKEINRNRREGVIIKTLEELDGYEGRLYELMNNNYFKYNRIPFPFRREFFKRLKDNLGKDVVIYISVKKDNLTGVCILLKRNEVGYASFVGVDHAFAGNDATYFNIMYYNPIMEAISYKTKKLYFGLGMYELKARRGCKVSDAYVFYKSFNKIKNIAIKPWFDFHSFWIRKNYRKW